MKTAVRVTVRVTVFWALLMTVRVCRSSDQNGQNQRAFPGVAPSAMLVTQREASTAVEVFREIDDPHTGDRWLLTRDPGRPGGPGRMVLAAVGPGRASQAGPGSANLLSVSSKLLPVIHTGDPLIVEETTAVVETRMAATALGPALVGSTFSVRLSIGGSVVRAIALGPGRARFAAETGSRP